MHCLSRLVLAAASLALAACAGPAVYAPAEGPGGIGFREEMLEDNRYRVSFAGKIDTPLSVVEDYILYRAAEITLATGNDWFRVDTRTAEPENKIVGSTVYLGAPTVITRSAYKHRKDAGARHSAKRRGGGRGGERRAHNRRKYGGAVHGGGRKRGHGRKRAYRKRHYGYKGGYGYKRGYSYGSSVSFAFGVPLYCCTYGFGYGYGYGYGYPAYGYARPVTRYDASVEIRVFPGEKPAEDPAAYTARAVIDAIGPRINRPDP